jgi:ferric-dicitrate binding protein FerR (iron transport regulator)
MREDTRFERGDAPADEIEQLLKLAGYAVQPSARRRARVREVVHAEWQDSVRARTRRRWMLTGVPALAAAAAIVAAVALWPRPTPIPPAPIVVARLAAATSPVVLTDGSGSRTVAAGDTIPVGAALQTAPDAVATMALDGGGELRMNGGTALRLTAARHVTIDRGHIYLDSGSSTGGGTLTIETFAGTVRDIGTRFDVQVRGDDLRVRVREGAVRLEGGSERHDVTAGRELSARGGHVTVRPTSTFGPDWDWIVRGTLFRLEGATLVRFFAWVEAEGGRQVEFSDPSLRDAVGGTVLHGSIEGLTVDDALAAILPASGLTHKLENGRVIVERTTHGAPR